MPALAVVLVGGLFSLGMLLATTGMRSDLAVALGKPWVIYKFAFAAMFAVAGIWLLRGSLRPQERRPLAPALLPCITIAGFALAVDLIGMDRSRILHAFLGDGPWNCIGLVALLSLVPAALLFWTLRHAAPRSPAIAGAAIGLLGGAAGMAVFALACTNDSAVFVGLWYGTALALVTALSALAGRRLLAW